MDTVRRLVEPFVLHQAGFKFISLISPIRSRVENARVVDITGQDESGQFEEGNDD